MAIALAVARAPSTQASNASRISSGMSRSRWPPRRRRSGCQGVDGRALGGRHVGAALVEGVDVGVHGVDGVRAGGGQGLCRCRAWPGWSATPDAGTRGLDDAADSDTDTDIRSVGGRVTTRWPRRRRDGGTAGDGQMSPWQHAARHPQQAAETRSNASDQLRREGYRKVTGKVAWWAGWQNSPFPPRHYPSSSARARHDRGWRKTCASY